METVTETGYPPRTWNLPLDLPFMLDAVAAHCRCLLSRTARDIGNGLF